MNYDYITGIIGDYPLPMILTFYFLFIVLFGKLRDKISSFIVFVASIFIVITADYDFSVIGNIVSNESYTQDVWLSILWDGGTALALTMFLRYDEHAWKQALLLAFATIYHSMILLYLTTDSTLTKEIVVFFYTWYDESIILIGLIQLLVSADGMANAIRGAKILFRRDSISTHGYN